MTKRASVLALENKRHEIFSTPKREFCSPKQDMILLFQQSLSVDESTKASLNLSSELAAKPL